MVIMQGMLKKIASAYFYFYKYQHVKHVLHVEHVKHVNMLLNQFFKS